MDSQNSRTYHSPTTSDASASAPHPGQTHTAKATIANLLQHLEPVLERHPIDDLGRPSPGQVVCYCHTDKSLGLELFRDAGRNPVTE
jgi:hypothetical protein